MLASDGLLKYANNLLYFSPGESFPAVMDYEILFISVDAVVPMYYVQPCDTVKWTY